MGPRKLVKPGSPKRGVAYLRVSTDEQNNGVAAQRAAITAWAERAGVRIVSWHEDRLSGATPVEDRPALLDAFESMRAQSAGRLVAAKRDRIARDVVVAATIESMARNAGGSVVTADGVNAEDTPEGALMRTLLDAFASYERALIRSRTRAALRVLKARGARYANKAPLGHAWVDGSLAADHNEQAQLARVREMRSRGLSYAAIARSLNTAGERCRGGKWHPTSVRRALTGQR